MAVNLTENAISLMSTGKLQATDVKPVLQVLDIGVLYASSQNITDRYWILLSDGSFYQLAMLATQLNDLVRSQQLQKGSVVQLNDFMTNTIRTRTIIMVIGVDLILSNCPVIGEPKPFPYSEPNQESYNAPIILSSPPVNSYIRPVNQPTPRTMYTNRRVFIAKTEVPSTIVPIAGLNPFRDRWTIKARVTAKTELRRCYNNAAKGEGKVFSFDLVDHSDGDGGEIRTTCFNDVADQLLYNQIKVGKVYFISDGKIKPAQKAYDHLNNDHEIRLDHTSTIWPCLDVDN